MTDLEAKQIVEAVVNGKDTKGKRGRPPGSKTRKKPVAKKKKAKKEQDGAQYRCTCCGKVFTSQEGNFWKANNSPLYRGNGGYVHICSDCIKQLYSELKDKYQSDYMALMCICYMTDRYFNESLYEKHRGDEVFDVGLYFRTINIAQYSQNTFYNTVQELIRNGRHTVDELRDMNEERWDKAAAKNKQDVIRIVGYDCFSDESYTETDRKWLFNTAMSYLNDDDVADDAHKIQQVISMVKTMLQVERIDRRIQKEFQRNNANDLPVFKELTNAKLQYVKIINSIACDNGISERSGKTAKAATTLSGVMRQMETNGFDEIKVNVVNSKLSKSYAEIAQANAKALINELNFTTDDYARMVASQADTITHLQEENEKLEEQRRKLAVQLKAYEAKPLNYYLNNENGGDEL